MDTFLVTCEHGGNRIPAAYQPYFADLQELLATHRGYDRGALVLARDLAKAFGAPLVSSTISRLLVDLNRSVGHPRLFSNALPRTPPSLRTKIVSRYHTPWRDRVEGLVWEAVAAGHRVVHLSAHSFTPVLNGRVRDTDMGLLHDPSRHLEADLCARWREILLASAPHLRVRRNHPYQGRCDGLTTHLRGRFDPGAYLGIEVEINQNEISATPRGWKPLRDLVIASLRSALDHESS